MAKGILGVLGFGKKDKPNLTPTFRELPHASDAPLFGTLEDFARKRISGETAGFGTDYMNKAANPITANMKARFTDETLPDINSNLSKRGIARSAGGGLATDIINRAERSNNRDIDEVMANFYQLNEAQKKTDINEGVRVGDQVNSQYLNQTNNRTNAFNEMQQGVTNAGIRQAEGNNAERMARQNQTINALVGSITGGVVPGANGAGMSFSGSGALTGAAKGYTGSGESATSANVAGYGGQQSDLARIEQLLRQKGLI